MKVQTFFSFCGNRSHMSLIITFQLWKGFIFYLLIKYDFIHYFPFVLYNNILSSRKERNTLYATYCGAHLIIKFSFTLCGIIFLDKLLSYVLFETKINHNVVAVIPKRRVSFEPLNMDTHSLAWSSAGGLLKYISMRRNNPTHLTYNMSDILNIFISVHSDTGTRTFVA